MSQSPYDLNSLKKITGYYADKNPTQYEPRKTPQVKPQLNIRKTNSPYDAGVK